MSNLLELGDTLVVSTMHSERKHKITRVTSTRAMSTGFKLSGGESVFKREISMNMSHPYESYPPATYKVIRKGE
jgi:hypothetical protein